MSSNRRLGIFKSLSQQYRQLTPEEFARYQEAGRAATLAHRAGHRSFGETRRNAPASRTLRLALPGDVMPSGAVVAADIERDQLVLPYGGPRFEDELEQHAAQLSSSLGTDGLSKEELAEVQGFQQDLPDNLPILSTMGQQTEICEGFSRDVFPGALSASSSSSAADLTGLRWTPPTARLAQAPEGFVMAFFCPDPYVSDSYSVAPSCCRFFSKISPIFARAWFLAGARTVGKRRRVSHSTVIIRKLYNSSLYVF